MTFYTTLLVDALVSLSSRKKIDQTFWSDKKVSFRPHTVRLWVDKKRVLRQFWLRFSMSLFASVCWVLECRCGLLVDWILTLWWKRNVRRKSDSWSLWNLQYPTWPSFSLSRSEQTLVCRELSSKVSTKAAWLILWGQWRRWHRERCREGRPSVDIQGSPGR